MGGGESETSMVSGDKASAGREQRKGVQSTIPGFFNSQRRRTVGSEKAVRKSDSSFKDSEGSAVESTRAKADRPENGAKTATKTTQPADKGANIDGGGSLKDFFSTKKRVLNGDAADGAGQSRKRAHKEVQDAAPATFQSEAVVVERAASASSKPEVQDSPRGADDIDQGALLLQALCAVGARTGGEEERATAAAGAEAAEEGAEEAEGAEDDKLGEAGAAASVRGLDQKDWAWEASCHEGLLTFHDGRKRWYHCTECEYFNDRLYHSKMHFERIHVKQGKSMPRKRKYMEPAGSNAGQAASLPPSSLQQPEPKGSRTRQPGDKWLKTLAAPDPATSGFRYESVVAAGGGGGEGGAGSGSEGSEQQSEEGARGGGAASPEAPPLSPTEAQRRADALQLSPTSARLWCWEGQESIGKGVQRGREGRSLLAYKKLFVFTAPAPPAGPPAPAAPAPIRPPPVHALPPASSLRWWWHRQRTDDESPPSPPHPRTSAAPASEVGRPGEEAGARGAPPSPQTLSPTKALAPSRPGPTEDGGPAAAGPRAPAGAAAGPGAGVGPGWNGRGTVGVEGGGGVQSKPRSAKEGTVKGGGVEGAKGKGGGAAKTKRGWKRWDAAEEAALAEAVRKLGTKDWGAIHQEMGTERSIKQLQDHWNDTKHDRKSQPKPTA